MISSSPSGKLDSTDLFKTMRGAAIIAGGYLLTALIERVLSDLTSGAINLGQYAMFQGVLVTVLSSALELARRWVTNHAQ